MVHSAVSRTRISKPNKPHTHFYNVPVLGASTLGIQAESGPDLSISKSKPLLLVFFLRNILPFSAAVCFIKQFNNFSELSQFIIHSDVNWCLTELYKHALSVIELLNSISCSCSFICVIYKDTLHKCLVWHRPQAVLLIVFIIPRDFLDQEMELVFE